MKKPPEKIGWLEVSNYQDNSVAYSIYSQPSNQVVEAIFYVISDNLERLLHPINGTPIDNRHYNHNKSSFAIQKIKPLLLMGAAYRI